MAAVAEVALEVALELLLLGQEQASERLKYGRKCVRCVGQAAQTEPKALNSGTNESTNPFQSPSS